MNEPEQGEPVERRWVIEKSNVSRSEADAPERWQCVIHGPATSAVEVVPAPSPQPQEDRRMTPPMNEPEQEYKRLILGLIRDVLLIIALILLIVILLGAA